MNTDVSKTFCKQWVIPTRADLSVFFSLSLNEIQSDYCNGNNPVLLNYRSIKNMKNVNIFAFFHIQSRTLILFLVVKAFPGVF